MYFDDKKKPSTKKIKTIVLRNLRKRNGELNHSLSSFLKFSNYRPIYCTYILALIISVGMYYNQHGMDALVPREVAVVQFITTNLCANSKTCKGRVLRTESTTSTTLLASDMKGQTIPRRQSRQ